MICEKPFMTAGGAAYHCGKCEPCRLGRVKLWKSRILLEAKCHEHNAFVTLTYKDVVDGQSLEPKDTQDWLKRLRKRVAPDRIRYFLVGEYSDSWRPHYHAILFGFPTCIYGQSQYRKLDGSCCYWCDLVRDTWGHGIIQLGSVETGSAGYICGYVTKSMIRFDDDRLQGRHPEFARMSLVPGLGRDYIFAVADSLMKHGLHKSREVRSFGRYLNSQLDKRLGVVERPKGLLSRLRKYDVQEKVSELRPLQLAARDDAQAPSFRKKVVDANENRRFSRLARSKIFRKRERI